MAENTKIEWTDHTFNPWIGCTKVGPGCDHCYAENLMDKRMGVAVWGPGNERVRTKPANWKMPLRWNAQADAFMAQHGRRQRVFCASLADVFDNAVPVQWRRDLFDLIEATPNLDWLLLTKRIGNARSLYAEAYLDSARPWPANVWLGATIVNQPEADRDIPKLLQAPSRVLFLSMEPLLGLVDIRRWLQPHCERHPGKLESDGKCEVCESRGIWGLPGAEVLQEHEKAPIRRGLDWVIVGGESGPGARPMHPEWARSLRDQCEAAGVPFLFKQYGDWKPISQMEEAEHSALYKPNVIAKPHENQDNLNDVYGRKCTVPTTVLHIDGSTHGIAEPMAFGQGTEAMQIFQVGKKAAGRLLDGRTWDGFPAP